MHSEVLGGRSPMPSTFCEDSTSNNEYTDDDDAFKCCTPKKRGKLYGTKQVSMCHQLQVVL